MGVPGDLCQPFGKWTAGTEFPQACAGSQPPSRLLAQSTPISHANRVITCINTHRWVHGFGRGQPREGQTLRTVLAKSAGLALNTGGRRNSPRETRLLLGLCKEQLGP